MLSLNLPRPSGVKISVCAARERNRGSFGAYGEVVAEVSRASFLQTRKHGLTPPASKGNALKRSNYRFAFKKLDLNFFASIKLFM